MGMPLPFAAPHDVRCGAFQRARQPGAEQCIYDQRHTGEYIARQRHIWPSPALCHFGSIAFELLCAQQRRETDFVAAPFLN
jgi:hypothetical protein